jgi:hypothetical protein
MELGWNSVWEEEEMEESINPTEIYIYISLN